MTILYAVQCSDGAYDEYREWIVCAFPTQEKAEAKRDRLQKQIDRDRDIGGKMMAEFQQRCHEPEYRVDYQVRDYALIKEKLEKQRSLRFEIQAKYGFPSDQFWWVPSEYKTYSVVELEYEDGE